MNTVKPEVYTFILAGNNILYCQYKIIKIHCRTGNYCTLDKDQWIMINVQYNWSQILYYTQLS